MALEKRLSRREMLENILKAGLGVALGGTIGSTPERAYSQVAIDPAEVYPPQDLVGAIGMDTYANMCVHRQRKAIESWNSKPQLVKDNIKQIYTDPEAFLKRIPEKSRQNYEKLRNAYARTRAKTDNAGSSIFIPRRGRITQEYAEMFPWIDLNAPTEGDMLLIFQRECMEEDTKGRRIDWNYVGKNGAEMQFGDLGPRRLFHDGEYYFREGNTNSYHSRSGKRLQKD